MSGNPCHCNSGIGNLIFFCDSVNGFVQLSILFHISQEGPSEKSFLERWPCLDRHVFQSGILQHRTFSVYRLIRSHIYRNTGINHRAMCYAQLKLIHFQFIRNIFLEQFHLHGVLIGYSKMPYFAFCVKLFKSLRHFFRSHQAIRSVQQQKVQIVSIQTF